MKDFDEYRLWIDAYTPETIPMERLAAYLSAFAKLLGHGDRVHFKKVDGGSTAPVAIVEREAVPKVWARVERAQRQDAANDEKAAFKELNEMARADNAVAKLFRIPAQGREATVLEFPGKDTPCQSKFGPFTEAASVVGELVRIGGKDATAHAALIDAEGKLWNGEVRREVAQLLAPYLYKVVRAVGDVRWERTEEGDWRMLSFKIASFQEVDGGGLLDGIEKLRALRDSEWAQSRDIDGEIRASRGHDDGLH